MQEFLINDTVNCNLMSLTGYRTLFLLDLLMESPKSTAEINEQFLNNKYIKENFSTDTLRIYINSLRMIGCDISRADKTTNHKFVMRSHPFELEIQKSQIKALSKLYKNIHDKAEIKDIVAIENLIDKINSLINNNDTKDLFKSISMLKNINKTILKELILHCQKRHQIKFLYKSPKSGQKEIEIITDKLEFKSEKLYLWGHSLNHQEYAYFRLDRILEILSVNIQKKQKEIQEKKVIFEVYGTTKNNYHIGEDEKIIERSDEKIVVESVLKNKFNFLQKTLHMTQDCKIIYPETLKKDLTEMLKTMQRSYE